MADVQDTIRDLVTSRKVVLFMKGSRHFPQCGFSAQVIQILDKLLPSYETVNVLSDPDMRDGIKRYSDWPTIPQLYVDGKFVGGCDIVREMDASGELARTLGVKAEPPKPPAISITERAAEAIRAAKEDPAEDLRLVVGPSFEHELFFDAAKADDFVVETSGVTLRVDPESARRAGGVSIDYVEAGGGGFKIENPNEPPRVRPMSPKALKEALDAKKALTLFDVRPADERRRASVAAAVALDDEAGQKQLATLPNDAMLVFMCHHGMRSRVAAEAALRQGFTRVYNLDGGIDAWSTSVDPQVPRY